MDKIQYIKDVLGNNYVGIDIYQHRIMPFLNELEEYVGDEKEYETLTSLQRLRDSGTWHITVINVFEYNALAKSLGMRNFLERLDAVMKMEFDDLIFEGIGKAERNGNTAYFVVCKSDFLASVRDSFGLNPTDFHCTLGFNRKDVHGVRKNEIITKKPKFLKIISNLYYKNNKSFNFLNDVKNLKTQLVDIEIISIGETQLTVRSGTTCYGFGLVGEGKDEILYNVSQFPDDKKEGINTYQVEKVLGKQ